MASAGFSAALSTTGVLDGELAQGAAEPTGGLVPRTRSSHYNGCESGCELRVQSGTRVYKVASVLRFRSSHRSVRQIRANFGIGTLAPMDQRTVDFIIVGAGSAGAALAHRLTENGRFHVLLLEAGGKTHPLSQVPISFARFINRPGVNLLYNSETQGHSGR